MRVVSEILTLKVKVKSKINPLMEPLAKEMHKYRRYVTMHTFHSKIYCKYTVLSFHYPFIGIMECEKVF